MRRDEQLQRKQEQSENASFLTLTPRPSRVDSVHTVDHHLRRRIDDSIGRLVAVETKQNNGSGTLRRARR